MSGNLISAAEADRQPLLHGLRSESDMERKQDGCKVLISWLRINSGKTDIITHWKKKNNVGFLSFTNTYVTLALNTAKKSIQAGHVWHI